MPVDQQSEVPLWYENYDLDHIYTPIDADKFEFLLKQAGYDRHKTAFIINGFWEGFPLHYQGETKIKRLAPNLKLRVGTKMDLWNKVMSEVKANRFAGPYTDVPYEYFIQSPIGLVPKDQGTKTRLIFHLSYSRKGNSLSVNTCIPKHFCSVKYPDFEQAVRLCLAAGKSANISKSDMSMAFRHAPMRVISNFYY